MSDARPEALFYHLTVRGLDDALPSLLQRCLDRGWRVTVRIGAAERLAGLNQRLWTFSDDSFLPHGTAEDGAADRQPVYLTAGSETPNAPDALFLVDGAQADAAEFARGWRTVVMFDGRDEAAVADARRQWKTAVNAGAACVYWAQTAQGGWEKKAESG